MKSGEKSVCMLEKRGIITAIVVAIIMSIPVSLIIGSFVETAVTMETFVDNVTTWNVFWILFPYLFMASLVGILLFALAGCGNGKKKATKKK